jgi:hypothetical protein
MAQQQKRQQQRRQQKHVFKTAGVGKRAIAVFGPPSCGVSSILECLCRASETPMQVVPYIGPASIVAAREALEHVDVVFLDVDGGLFGAADVQALVDNRLIHHGAPGAVIRIHAPDAEVLERASSRPGYVTDTDLQLWSRSVPEVERRIRDHNLAYFMLPNVDLAEAVEQLALRAGVTR